MMKFQEWFLFINIYLACGLPLQMITLTWLQKYNYITPKRNTILMKSLFLLTIFSGIIIYLLAGKLSSFHDSSMNYAQQFSSFYTQIQPSNNTLSYDTIKVINAYPSLFTLSIYLLIILGIFRYVKETIKLYEICHSSVYYKKSKTVNIGFSSNISSPLCFTFLHRAYILLPCDLLEDFSLLKTAIKHEIYHLKHKDGFYNHALSLLNIVCGWNPVWILYRRWFSEMQEYAVDAQVAEKCNSKVYAKALLKVAKKQNNKKSQYTYLMINTMNFNAHQLKRRILMLNKNTSRKNSTLTLFLSIIFCSLTVFSTGIFATSQIKSSQTLSMTQLQKLVKDLPGNPLDIQANSYLLNELNGILSDSVQRDSYKNGIARIKSQTDLAKILADYNLPQDLMAIELTESRGIDLPPEMRGNLNNAGLWQQIPAMATRYGLTVNNTVDQRIDPIASTKASAEYLRDLHAQTQQWPLAIMAYNAGIEKVNSLEEKYNTKSPWDIIANANTPAEYEYQHYLPNVQASVILLHNPELLNS